MSGLYFLTPLYTLHFYAVPSATSASANSVLTAVNDNPAYSVDSTPSSTTGTVRMAKATTENAAAEDVPSNKENHVLNRN